MCAAKSLHGLAPWPLWRLSVLFTSWHLIAVATFSVGFLLTRVELPHKNAYTPNTDLSAQSCSPEAQLPVQRMVWMIIDALRWDFVSNSSSISSASAAAMPIMQSIACAAVRHTSWQPRVIGMCTYTSCSCYTNAAFAGISCFSDQICCRSSQHHNAKA